MARKSRKYVIENKNNSVFKVAGYIRLSVSHEEENTSISTQEHIIEDYVNGDADKNLDFLYNKTKFLSILIRAKST